MIDFCLSCEETTREVEAWGYTMSPIKLAGTPDAYRVCSFCDQEVQELYLEYCAARREFIPKGAP